eukprot:gb/GECG01001535.1/.p1 GENE.gb/GECG01001535.1/~~gb/GECG01001535.1/.p1  ORF type:complete len:199 (+),score=7.43 gb/GECG01001535.1/:1-597(+)
MRCFFFKGFARFTVPVCRICAADTGFEARHFLRASSIFNATVLPLIQNPMDRLAAVVLSCAYHYLAYVALNTYHSGAQHQRRITAGGTMSIFELYGHVSFYRKGGLPADNVTSFSIYWFRCLSSIFDSAIYTIGLVGVVAFHLFHPFIVGNDSRLEFLPLMLMSFYCAIGVVVIDVELLLLCLRRREVADAAHRKYSQ